MRARRVWYTMSVLTLSPAVTLAQSNLEVRTSVLFESYSFDPGLAFTKISEFTVPVGITYGLGRFGNIALSTGFASVNLSSADQTRLADQTVSGVVDTEVRLSVNVVPGRLVALVTGTVPTGVDQVQFEELSVLGAISSDVIGFSTSNFGAGGNVGGGFAGAVPVGDLAVGFGGTVRLPMEYRPVIGQPGRLRPGTEFRLRTGVEGPVARRTYIRVAGIFARRSKDEIDGATQNGVGNRIIGYVSVNQGIGSSSLTLYGFDVFRADPQLEATAAGAAILPRGNLIAFGGRFSVPISRTADVVPRLEYRISDQAVSATVTSLRRFGSSFRFGVDFRTRATQHLAVVVQGSGLMGSVKPAGTTIDFNGFRAAVHVEVIP